METNVNVFAPSRTKRVLSQRCAALTFVKTRTHDPLSYGQINAKTSPIHNACFTLSPRATYSASDVDNEMHLCVLIAQLTAAPSKVITVHVSKHLSSDLSA